MKKSAMLFSVLITLLIINSSDIYSQSSKTFNVGKGGTLEVSTTFGDIEIKTWEKDEIFVKYDADEDEEELVNDIKFNQSGNNLTIKATDGYGTSFEITVPVNYNLKLVTQAGDIIVSSALQGEVTASTSGGDVRVKDIDGKVKLVTSGGDVLTGNINGNANISSAGGDLKTGGIKGDAVLSTGGGNVIILNTNKTLTVSTGGGNVSVGNTGGVTKVTTGGGNVAIGKVNGAAVITTGGGDIKVEGVTGEVKSVTGSGNVSIVSNEDNVNVVSGAGDVFVTFHPGTSGESKIVTGYGNIKLSIPENSKTTIVAKIKGKYWADSKDDEGFKSDFPSTTVNKDGNSITTIYQINGGGSEVNVETGSGTIEIRKLKK